jgi:hypothetical protein
VYLTGYHLGEKAVEGRYDIDRANIEAQAKMKGRLGLVRIGFVQTDLSSKNFKK